MAAVESLTIHDSLKNGVSKEHEEAENGVFTQSIMKGTVTPSIYRQFLVELYQIYSAMEEMAELNQDHETFGATHFPVELNRVGAIEKDLEYYYGGPEWKTLAKSVAPTTAKYVARITEVGNTNPTLLIAHCYVRYLGDMSGGRQIKYKLSKFFNLGNSKQGLQFFEFDQISNIKDFKDFYFGRMNSISIDDGQLTELVNEAKQAFRYNIDLFHDMNNFVEQNKSLLEMEGKANGNNEDGGSNKEGNNQAGDSGNCGESSPRNFYQYFKSLFTSSSS
ncbi:heme oxygenase 1-like [Argonauta hians]